MRAASQELAELVQCPMLTYHVLNHKKEKAEAQPVAAEGTTGVTSPRTRARARAPAGAAASPP